MFPLRTRFLPRSADALRDALEEGLRSILQPPFPRAVTVEDANYPELAAIRISLDNAVAVDAPPPLPQRNGTLEPGLRVKHLEINGQAVRVQRAAIDLSCVARDARIAESRDHNGNVLLLLQEAAEGKIDISLPVADLQALVRSGATAAAAKHGVMLEDLRLQVRAETARTLALQARVRARKLFLNTELRLSGRLEIDEQMNAEVSGLECLGEGTLGTLACGFLGPYLERFNKRKYSLVALPLGEVKLRDIQIAVDSRLRVSALFGSDGRTSAL